MKNSEHILWKTDTRNFTVVRNLLGYEMLGLVQVIQHSGSKNDKLFRMFLTTLKVKFPGEIFSLQV
jgi:hypothetical protein